MSTNGNRLSAAALVEAIEENVAESARQLEKAEAEIAEWRRRHALMLAELTEARLDAAAEAERQTRSWRPRSWLRGKLR